MIWALNKLSFFLISAYCYAHQLYEGDDCIIQDSQQKGKCTNINNCPEAASKIHENVYPQLCGFNVSDPIICCTTIITNRIDKKSLSEQKCEQYIKETEDIEGYFHIVVVGGSPAKLGDFPHMVALGYNFDNKIVWQCGGSLISENFVLTAAHCLSSQEYGSVSWVRIGEITVDDITVTIPSVDYRVIQKIAYPDYKPPSIYHDIALLQLDSPVKWKSNIKPACLYYLRDIVEEETTGLKATGWGLTEYNGDKSTVLLQVKLKEFPNDECNSKYKNLANTRKLKNGIINSLQICAGGRDEEKDTCQGDSGGPLQIKEFDSPLHRIVGVTSFGKGCGVKNIPGVYVKVSHYIPWIESIVWKS